jgi:hypothetical protein
VFGVVMCIMGLMSIYAVVYKYPNAPIPAMATQPAGVTEPAPTTVTPGTTNPSQPGEVR